MEESADMMDLGDVEEDDNNEDGQYTQQI